MSSSGGPYYSLCADIGTSSLKAALIDEDGALCGFSRQAWGTLTSKTVFAADWERSFYLASQELSAKVPSSRIRAICISGNGPSLVPIDHKDNALAVQHWYLPTTHRQHDCKSLFLPAAAELFATIPQAETSVKRLFSCQEWLAWRLGADAHTSLPTPLYADWYWDAAQLECYGLDSALFPAFTLPGERVGVLSKEAAERCGLLAGTPIVSSGPDFFMAILGVGAISEGMVCDRAGTSEGLNVCAREKSSKQQLRSLPHVQEGLWNVSAMLPSSGHLFEWFRSITGQEDRNYTEMLQEIVHAHSRSFSECPPPEYNRGSFFFPHLNEQSPLCAANAFISTSGLTTRAELGRAVVEAIGFMVCDAIDMLEETGLKIESMRLSGGQAKNKIWNQMKADISGRTLLQPEIVDGELAGNACAALTALGEASSLSEAAERIVRISHIYEASQSVQTAWAERRQHYNAWRKTYARLDDSLLS